MINGALIYSVGDTIASLLLDEFLWSRLFGMLFIGATVYAFEIPNYFSWIEKKTIDLSGISRTMAKTALAILYFNPLWIARHLFFIKIFSGNIQEVNNNLLVVAFWSFFVNIPISFIANYIIQNRFHFKWRFIASAIFSGFMAIYYASSENIFN